MLSNQQATDLFTQITLALAKKDPAALNSFHQPVQGQAGVPLEVIAKVMKDPHVITYGAGLLENAGFPIGQKIFHEWCEEKIGPGVVIGGQRSSQTLIIDLGALQSLCAREQAASL